jgi:mono/diheme cytochrome c family protein
MLVFAAAACLVLCGCRVKAPGPIETGAIDWSKHNVTVGGRYDHNLVPATQENIRSGEHAFGYYCVACHGLDGQNTGVPFAESLSPPIPPLTSRDVQSYTDGQLKWVITNGIAPSGMPASKGMLSDDDIWRIVLFLRHLPPAGSRGEPRIYSGDGS